jgi:hypothetical protein
MKTILYMNERIKHKHPNGPVIRAVRGKDWLEANTVYLTLGGEVIGKVVFDPKNNPSDTHMVKAWIELEDCVRVSL